MFKSKKAKRSSGATLIFASISLFLMVAPAVASSYFGIGIFTVISNSMKPYIAAGDAIVTDVVLARDLSPGEVVLVRNPDTLEQITHRVVSVTSSDNRDYTIVTKGDSNPVVDSPSLVFNADAPLRRVIGVAPKIGYVINEFSSTPVRLGGLFLIVIYLFALLFIFRKKSKSPVPPTIEELSPFELEARAERTVKEHFNILENR